MTISYKVLGQTNPSANTAANLYVVPSGTSSVISTLNICNLSAGAASFRIAVRPLGTTLANVHYIAYDTPVPGNDSISMTLGITVSATDIIAVQANSALVSFSAFGTEIS